MSGDFRLGDVTTAAGPLRFTIGALAELAARLDASDPAALSDRLRGMDERIGRILLAALLRPCAGREAETRLNAMSEAAIADLLPAASRCIADAVSGAGR